MMLELEMDSCSSSCLLYILIFSFSLSRESWRMMMFFLSSSDCKMSSLMLLVLVCSSVMVAAWDFFSLLSDTPLTLMDTPPPWDALINTQPLMELTLINTQPHLELTHTQPHTLELHPSQPHTPELHPSIPPH